MSNPEFTPDESAMPHMRLWRPVEFMKRQAERVATFGGAIIHILTHQYGSEHPLSEHPKYRHHAPPLRDEDCEGSVMPAEIDRSGLSPVQIKADEGFVGKFDMQDATPQTALEATQREEDWHRGTGW